MAKPNPSSKIRLLLADVDGTLVTKDKVLTERARKAVLALKDKNIRFALTSGRPPKGMKMLFDPLQIDTPIAGFNGGSFTNFDLSIIEQKVLAPDIAKKALELILAHKMDAWVYNGDDWFIRNARAPHVDREAHTVQFQAKIVHSLEHLLDAAVKIVGISDDHDLVAQAEKDVQAAIGNKASAARSQPYYLDVTNKQANKGAVVTYLSDFFKIPAQEIATIGDMPNDVVMFDASGLSIAMGNASKEVQEKANFTTDSYEDEGFAKAVERYILSA